MHNCTSGVLNQTLQMIVDIITVTKIYVIIIFIW